jgi:hypothetical protein
MYIGSPACEGSGDLYMIEAASVASPRSKSPEVFAGGTDERDVLLDLFPRRWVTVAKADRILDVCVDSTATTCCVGGMCSYGQKAACMCVRMPVKDAS